MEMYLISYQKQGSAPVVYVASDNSLMATVNQALKESEGAPVLVSSAKTI
jgi:hypothetical protein